MCHKYLEGSNVFIVLLCFLCTSFSAEAKDTQQIGLQIEDLIQMAAASRDELSTIDVTYEINQALPKSSGARGITNIKRRLFVDFKNSSYYEERSLISNFGKTETKAIESYDGQNRMFFLPKNKIGSIDDREVDQHNLQRTLRDKMPLLIAALMYPPENDGVGIDDGSMVSLLKHGTLRKKTETIDGRETYVVDAKLNGKLYATVWLDIERGVMPLRAVLYGHDGEISSDKQITDIREFDNGAGNKIWLPVSFNLTRLVKGEKAEISTKIEPDKLRVNLPTERSMFRITFPPGTTIHDSVIDLTYQIPGGELSNYIELNDEKTDHSNDLETSVSKNRNLVQSDKNDEAQASNPDAGEFQNKTSSPTVDESENANSYILVVSAAVLLIIASSLLVGRRRRKRHN